MSKKFYISQVRAAGGTKHILKSYIPTLGRITTTLVLGGFAFVFIKMVAYDNVINFLGNYKTHPIETIIKITLFLVIISIPAALIITIVRWIIQINKRTKNTIDNIKRNGTRLTGTISLVHHESIPVRNDLGEYWQFQVSVEYEGKTLRFASLTYVANIFPYVHKDDKIIIYILPHNPRYFHIDDDFLPQDVRYASKSKKEGALYHKSTFQTRDIFSEY